jgi:hypothetical protein
MHVAARWAGWGLACVRSGGEGNSAPVILFFALITGQRRATSSEGALLVK